MRVAFSDVCMAPSYVCVCVCVQSDTKKKKASDQALPTGTGFLGCLEPVAAAANHSNDGNETNLGEEDLEKIVKKKSKIPEIGQLAQQKMGRQ